LQRGEFVLFDSLVEISGFVIAKIQHIEHGALRQKQKSPDGPALFCGQFEFAKRLFSF